MHLTAVNKIVIQQTPDPTNTQWPNRKKTFTFNKVQSFEADSCWSCLTDTAKVKFPKYFTVKDENGVNFTFGQPPGGRVNNQSITANYGNMAPLFMRGDAITIYTGYAYMNTSNNPVYTLNPVFDGYITSINNQTAPIEVECQDTMYQFKQVQLGSMLFPAATSTLESMIQQLVDLCNSTRGTNITYATNPTGISTNIGDFRIENETIAQVLERLQKDYKIEAFFQNNFVNGVNNLTFYCGLITYYPGVANTYNFVFQKTIIAERSKLNYTRADDVKIGIHAYSVNKTETASTTKSGRTKTKSKRLEVTVGTSKENGGQVRTMYYWNVLTAADLTQKANESLKRFYYEGWRGKFMTFALPTVKQGDIVSIDNSVLPEQTGDYFVKSVKYSGGIDGNFQEIELDLRIDGVFNTEQLNLGI